MCDTGMTSDDYLAIFCVAIPMVIQAIAVAVIVMKQGWIKPKGG